MCVHAVTAGTLTQQGAGLGEHVSVALVEDASEILSELQVLDLIFSHGDVSGPERDDSKAQDETLARLRTVTAEFEIHSKTRVQMGDTRSHCGRLLQHVFGNSGTGGGNGPLIFSFEMRLCLLRRDFFTGN